MNYSFPRRGYKFDTCLQILCVGAAAFVIVGLALLKLYVRADETERLMWQVLLLAWTFLVAGIVTAEIWSVFAREELLLENALDRIKRKHPKSYRVGTLWVFWGLLMGVATFLAYFLYSPGNEDRNLLIFVAVAMFDIVVLWWVAKRTRRIMLRVSNRRHGYGK